MNSIYNSILLNLSDDTYITSKELGERALISEKTVRNYIKTLIPQLEENGALIESKHGYGFRLIVSDIEKFTAFQASLSKGPDQDKVPESAEERMNYIIRELMSCDDPIGIEEFIDYLCVSEYTLQTDINRAKKLLNRYSLKISYRKDKGYKIEGNEFDRRIFIVSSGIGFFTDPDKNEIRRQISEIMLKVLDEHQISMPEVSINNMINYLYLMLIRLQEEKKITEEEISEAQQEEDHSVSLMIADKVADEFEKTYEIDVPKIERKVLGIHFFSHRVTGLNVSQGSNIIISQRIYDLVMEILMFINISLKVDLRNNLNTIMNLAVHMVALDVRIRYRIDLKNPSLADIKKMYAFGYTLASLAKTCIDKKYDCDLSEDEVAYLALIFEVSIRSERRIQKKNILIVCATGKTSAELLAYQYRDIFGKYLGNVETCNINELDRQDFSHIDYVLTTTPISQAVPVPIFRIRMMLNEEDEEKLKEQFIKENEIRISEFYRKELFFTDIEGEEKYEILKKLCELTEKNIEVPDGLYEAVVDREKMAATDFGEDAALAHPVGFDVPHSFAAVAVLKDPVFWGNHNVSIVILICIADGSQGSMQDFYKATSKFLMSRKKSQRLLEDPTYENLLSLLKE